MVDLGKLKRIVDIEYNDITKDSNIYRDKLRVFIRDGSFDRGHLVFKEDTRSFFISLGEKTGQWDDISS